MDLDRIAPDLRRAVRRMPRLPLHVGPIRRVLRRATGRQRGRPVEGVELTVVQRRGGPPLPPRRPRPREVRSAAAVFWIHGGGYVLGSPALNDAFCGELARELGVVVAAVGYRLAPEHPFPAGLDDCTAGWDVLQDAASWLGLDPARIAVGGQSAGGGLAAALVQRLAARGGVQPAAQWLFCPMLDDRTAARRDLDLLRHRVWDNRSNEFGWRSYLGAAPGGPTVPEFAVPARTAEVGGLPPTWIGVGDVDLFRDEDADYADRLTAAGVDTTFVEVPGAPHGFESWAADAALSRGYVRDATAWLAKALGLPAR